jgi:hypothetical protein
MDGILTLDNQFCQAVAASRSNLVHHIKHGVKLHLLYSSEFTQTVIDLYNSDDDDRAELKEFIGFDSKKEKYELLGLYVMGTGGTTNIQKVFNVPHLAKVWNSRCCY